MSAGLRLPQPKSPEWLHSGRYLLIALALHVLVLLYPLTLSIDQLEAMPPSPVQVQLTERVSAVQAIPPAPPEKAAAPKPVPREKPAQTARPVIALAPEQASAPPTFSVPAPIIAAPPVSQPAAAPAASSAQPAITAARFNAAYLNNPEPKYPSLSRRLGEEGKVLLRVRVTPDGRAATVDIEKSSNYDRLDEAARQSVANWRFVPAKRGDEAIEATVIVPIVFRLDN
ncbi:MAG: energy transducer TonB [Azonexus sp.]